MDDNESNDDEEIFGAPVPEGNTIDVTDTEMKKEIETQTQICVDPVSMTVRNWSAENADVTTQTSLTIEPNESNGILTQKLSEYQPHEGRQIVAAMYTTKTTVTNEADDEVYLESVTNEVEASSSTPSDNFEATEEKTEEESVKEFSQTPVEETEEGLIKESTHTTAAQSTISQNNNYNPQILLASVPYDAEIKNKLEKCSTPMEKELLLAMVNAMKTLNVELINLRGLYEQIVNNPEKLNEENIDDIANENKLTEFEKYELDLLSPDADEFPMAVFITQRLVKISRQESELKFDQPARNIKDFEIRHDDELGGIQAMLDTDLSAKAGPLDRNIFTVGSKLPFTAGDLSPKIKSKPMFDTHLTGGTIPQQIGLTRRRDMTIFLEDYIQYAMTDSDLLVKPFPCGPKKDTDDVDGVKPQWDYDLGRENPMLKQDLMADFYTCFCFDKEELDCPCGCQGTDEDSDNFCLEDEEDSNISIGKRGMFDYDLEGGLIKKPKQPKEDEEPAFPPWIGGPMYDIDLCHPVKDIVCVCFDRKESCCMCKCNDDGEDDDVIDIERVKPMYDYNLGSKKVPPNANLIQDVRTYKGERAMFDVDLCPKEQISGSGSVISLDDQTEPGEGMFDYHLRGDLIDKVPRPQMDPTKLRNYNGIRGMFDIDLAFALDSTKTKEGVCCICYNSLQPNCQCGCTVQDINQDECKCIGDSIPRPMWDVDLIKKRMPKKKPLDDVKPKYDPCNTDIPGDRSKNVEEKEEEEEEKESKDENIALEDGSNVNLPWDKITCVPKEKPKKIKKKKKNTYSKPPTEKISDPNEEPCPITPCPPGGCQACRMGQTDKTCNAFLNPNCNNENSKEVDPCENYKPTYEQKGTNESKSIPEQIFKPENISYGKNNKSSGKEVSVMYARKEDDTCDCSSSVCFVPDESADNNYLAASAKARTVQGISMAPVVNTNVTVQDLDNTAVQVEPLLATTESTVLRTKFLYRVSKPQFNENELQRTIRTKIEIIPKPSNTMSTTASQTEATPMRENVVTNALTSYENEIRPLREALASLQQKIKGLNLQDVGNTIAPKFEKPTSVHFGTKSNFSNTISTQNTNYPYTDEKALELPYVAYSSNYSLDPQVHLKQIGISQQESEVRNMYLQTSNFRFNKTPVRQANAENISVQHGDFTNFPTVQAHPMQNPLVTQPMLSIQPSSITPNYQTPPSRSQYSPSTFSKSQQPSTSIRSPLAEMYVSLARKGTSSSTFHHQPNTRSPYRMPITSSEAINQVMGLTPQNFIVGSTALRTDPDSILPKSTSISYASSRYKQK